ncbi:MAG: isopropylmalate isomerase [Rhodobacteraceae bacterium]|nr:isopropylmalate isomerase [Paracoccaceae bacterium]
MTLILAFALNLDDRARLRERFFGATCAVLARS